MIPSGTRWASPYVGLRFVDGGRSRKGVDCWGLVRLVYADVAGIDLPSHDTVSARDLLPVVRRIGEALAIPPWTTRVPPGEERALDVVVMSEGRLPAHVGLVVERGRFLHAQDLACSVIMATSDPAVSRRIVGIWRHDALA